MSYLTAFCLQLNEKNQRGFAKGHLSYLNITSKTNHPSPWWCSVPYRGMFRLASGSSGCIWPTRPLIPCACALEIILQPLEVVIRSQMSSSTVLGKAGGWVVPLFSPCPPPPNLSRVWDQNSSIPSSLSSVLKRDFPCADLQYWKIWALLLISDLPLNCPVSEALPLA